MSIEQMLPDNETKRIYLFMQDCAITLQFKPFKKNFTSDYSDRDAQGLTRAERAVSVRIYGIHHGNFSLAASNREPARLLNIWNMIGREDQRHAPCCWRHTGAATPPSSEDVVVVHAASTSLSVILHRRPTLRAAHAWR